MTGNRIFNAFTRAVRRGSDNPAIEFGDRRWTYLELWSAAITAGEQLRARGVTPGERVAFLGRNSDAYAIGFLACQAIGAIHMPINFMLEPGEIAYLLGHATPCLLFADQDYLEPATKAVERTEARVPIAPIEALVAAAELRSLESGDDQAIVPAQLAYTSGTESRPKGALLSDAALLYQHLSCIEVGEYRAADVYLHALPLYHCAQMHCFLLPSLLIGSRNIILDRADPGDIIRQVGRRGITALFAPPTVWIGILNHPAFAGDHLATLAKGYYGASIMPADVLVRLSAQLPWVRLWNYYGQTEIGPLAAALRPEEHAGREGVAGRPVLFVETRIVDDAMIDVKTGEVGEIVHRSPQLMLEYYLDPERTAAAFEDGWFRTGDLGIMSADGFLTVVDRKKDMIKTGGENVASREVEEFLYRHEAVKEVAVVGLPDEKWIERVCAVVVLKDGFEPSDVDLLGHARALAGFKRPKEIRFVSSLPKSASGKILKRELRLQIHSETSSLLRQS